MNDASERTWQKFFREQDESHRNALILLYLPLLEITVQKVSAKLGSSVELEDLMIIGSTGLVNAIEQFDPQLGPSFEIYCCQQIRGAILSSLREEKWIPQFIRTRLRDLARARQRLEFLLKRMPVETELAAEMELDMAEFRRLQHTADAVFLIETASLPASDPTGDSMKTKA